MVCRNGLLAAMLIALGTATSTLAVDIEGTDVTIQGNQYPSFDNHVFKSGAGNTGRLVLDEPLVPPFALLGNMTLQRDATVRVDGAIESGAIIAMGGSTLDLGGNVLTIERGLDPAAGDLNFAFGNGGAGTFAATSTGRIVARAADQQNPAAATTIFHLGGAASNANGSDITFEMYGGGLSIDRETALPQTATLIGKHGVSLILPAHGSTVGSSFTFQVDSDGGNETNTGGMFLLGDHSSGSPSTADVTYNGQLTYNGTNYVDDYGQAWGKASIVVGKGAFSYADNTFANTEAIAIGGRRNFLDGSTDDSIWATLTVANQTNLNALPGNIGFCGGKLDASALGATVDLRSFNLAAIAVNTGDGTTYPGGGYLVVDGTQAVTVRISAERLLTRDGILGIEQKGSGGSVIVEIDCNGGTVDPEDFAGFDVPNGTTITFTNVAGDDVATGNLEGSGEVNAGGKNLLVGSDVDTTGDFTGQLQNVQTLKKTGCGKTKIGSGANVTAQSAQIDAGELSVQQGATFNVGGGTGTLTVGNGGTLSGNGTVQGNVTVGSGGWLKPGNSIDVHNTTGNLTVQSSGNVEIEVEALPGGTTEGTPGTHNDLERVSGAIGFESGASVVVTENTPGGTYKAGDRYYAMVAEGGNITGASGARVLDTLPGVTIGSYGVESATKTVGGGVGDVTGNWLWFELAEGFYAETSNAVAMSGYLDSLNGAGQMGALYSAVDGLTGDQQAAALKALSGESVATSQSMTLDNTAVFTQVLLNQIRPRTAHSGGAGGYAYDPIEGFKADVVRGQNGGCCSAWQGWSTGYGIGGAINADANTSATGIGVGGALVAIERAAGEFAKLGFYYNYGHAFATNDSLNATSRLNDHFFGAYATQQLCQAYWLATLGFGYDDYYSQRRVTVGGIDELARGSHYGWQSMVYGETGLDLAWHALHLQPFLGLQYIYLREEPFSENAGSAPNTSLSFNGMDFNSLRTHLGGRVERPFCWNQCRGSVEFRSAWVHELLKDTAPVVAAKFTGASGGTTFAANGAELGRDWAWLGSGLKWRLSDTVSLYADYDLMVNIRQTLHTGSGGVTWVW